MRRLWLLRLAVLLLVGVLIYWPLGAGLPALPVNPAEPPPLTEVQRLIKDLGSDAFETREAAMRALIAFDEEPRNLRQALKSPDLEVRRRVARILEAYLPKRARHALAKVEALAKEGRVDEMVERLVLWKKWGNGQSCKSLIKLAGRLAERADRAFGKTQFSRNLPPIKTMTAGQTIQPKDIAELWQGTLKIVREDKIVLSDRRSPSKSKLMIVAGDVDIPGSSDSILLAGGNVRLRAAWSTIVICDGECAIRGGIIDSLIIARGKVTCPRQITRSVILGEDAIVFTAPFMLHNSMISNGGPNGFVPFFDPADVGLAVRGVIDKKGNLVSDGGTWIHAVREGTPFAARLRSKDIVTAIDASKTPCMETFRKVLRRKLAEGGPSITFHVRRAGKTLEVPVPVKD